MIEIPLSALIIGCGYLGEYTAAILRKQECDVLATTRSVDRWPTLRSLGVHVAQFDITADSTHVPIPEGWRGERFDAYFMLPPSAFASALAPGGGFDQLIRDLNSASVRRALLVSSTAAYGDSRDGVVTAESVADPVDTRGRRIVGIENRWRQGGAHFHVCRVAGLYGPGRIIGRRQLVNAENLPGDPAASLNLIHVADAAALLVACMRSNRTKAVELGSDGHPVARSEYYRYLAAALGAPVPHFDPSSLSRSGSKRCDPSSTSQRVDWQPQYPDFRQGLAAMELVGDES